MLLSVGNLILEPKPGKIELETVRWKVKRTTKRARDFKELWVKKKIQTTNRKLFRKLEKLGLCVWKVS